jgi:hypothetical protein
VVYEKVIKMLGTIIALLILTAAVAAIALMVWRKAHGKKAVPGDCCAGGCAACAARRSCSTEALAAHIEAAASSEEQS